MLSLLEAKITTHRKKQEGLGYDARCTLCAGDGERRCQGRSAKIVGEGTSKAVKGQQPPKTDGAGLII